LLNSFGKTQSLDKLRAEAARRFNNTALDEWRFPRPALADKNPEDVTNADYEDAMPKNPKFVELDAAAWQRVRAYVLELAREVK
jgi:hypothetical protein